MEEAIWQRILRDPRLLLHRLERGPEYESKSPALEHMEALFLPMSRRHYRLSSHLDRRIVASRARPYRVNLRQLLNRGAEIEAAAGPVAFVFHTAFCGSTLLANCLDREGVCLAYKEPLFLSQICLAKPVERRPPVFSESQWLELLRCGVGLLSKRFQTSEIALLKPSNPCNIAIRELMSAGKESRGVFLYSNLRDFLCSTLKSEGRRQWVREVLKWTEPTATGALSRVGPEESRDEIGAAYIWIWQMYHYLDVCAERAPAALCALNGDDFLRRPEEALAAVCDFLSLPFSSRAIGEIVHGKVMRSYSKFASEGSWLASALRATGLPLLAGRRFDYRKRQSLLNQTAERHREELERGLAWAKATTEERPIPEVLPRSLLD